MATTKDRVDDVVANVELAIGVRLFLTQENKVRVGPNEWLDLATLAGDAAHENATERILLALRRTITTTLGDAGDFVDPGF